MINHETSAITRVCWTEEERASIANWITDWFTTSGVPYANWKVTDQLLNAAQFPALQKIERVRNYIRNTDLTDMQSRVDQFIFKKSTDGIIKDHQAYVELHGISPVDHAMSLLEENEALHARIALLQSELTTLKSVPKTLVQTVVARKEIPTVLPARATKAHATVLANHLSDTQRRSLEKLCDINWIDRSQKVNTISKARYGKSHAFVVEGHLPKEILTHVRDICPSVTLVNGYASLHKALLEFAQ